MCEAGGVDAQTRRERFEELAPDLIEPLRRFLARRTDAATADDVLSETLLVCWRRLEELPDEPLPWAYAVARNCLANAERGARRQQRVAARIGHVRIGAGVEQHRGQIEIGVEDRHAERRCAIGYLVVDVGALLQ